jgi:cytidine deaminase
MNKQTFQFNYDVYASLADLGPADRLLLGKATEVIGNAYAPYSNFKVAAAASLSNGEIVTGTNQENAAFPAGLCAERIVLGTVGSAWPKEILQTMAITYYSEKGENEFPISPCGICRQSMQEYETRMNSPIRLILSGSNGKIFVIESAAMLLPLSFGRHSLSGRK